MDCTNNKSNFVEMINTRKKDKIIDKKLMQKVSKVMKIKQLFIYIYIYIYIHTNA
jgi:hypothetical protein